MKTKKLLFAFTVLIYFISQTNIFSQGFQQTQCRNGLNLNIIQNGFTRDSVLVSLGNGCIVQDVNVILDTILHTWVSDMLMYLQKENVIVQIISNVGGSGDNFIRTKLDDSASIPIASGTAPFTGTFRPSNPLTPFIGISPNGYWKFSINDIAGGDGGTLKAWCIQLTFTCPTGGIQTVEIPNTYRLYQNYPNPFNPVTKIKYGLPKNGYVKLTVYDGLGKEVDVIDEGYKGANTYEAIFDSTNLPSGVYYYKLEFRLAGSSVEVFTDTKKMMIVK